MGFLKRKNCKKSAYKPVIAIFLQKFVGFWQILKK